MPRQLPWLNKGARITTTQAKPVPKTSKKSRIESDIDDDFFKGTIFDSARKGNERKDNPDSGDDLPDLPVGLEHRGTERAQRALSSSPPPAESDLPPPEVEYMRTGTGKFDLRDDEWMMVEDEFLQTAKLFTRHLHLAEYERLKQNIEEKKKEATPRPVVPHSKPSDEGRMRMKAEAQRKAQKKAFREVSMDDDDDDIDPPGRIGASKSITTSFLKPLNSKTTTSSSSRRDLDHPPRKPLGHSTTFTSSDLSDEEDLDMPKRSTKSSDRTVERSSTSSNTRSFLKPTMPSKPRPQPSRPTRPSTFTSFDNYSPPLKRPTSPTKKSQASTSNSSTSTSSKLPNSSKHRTTTATEERPAPSLFDLWDDPFPKQEPPSASVGHVERLAKRKAEGEKEKEKEKEKQKQKRQSINIDDIPTFAF